MGIGHHGRSEGVGDDVERRGSAEVRVRECFLGGNPLGGVKLKEPLEQVDRCAGIG